MIKKKTRFKTFTQKCFSRNTLREKCPNTELFEVHIQSKCGEIRTRKNSVFGHISHSDMNTNYLKYFPKHGGIYRFNKKSVKKF